MLGGLCNLHARKSVVVRDVNETIGNVMLIYPELIGCVDSKN